MIFFSINSFMAILKHQYTLNHPHVSEGGRICNELRLSFTVDTVISNINIKVRLPDWLRLVDTGGNDIQHVSPPFLRLIDGKLLLT